MLANTPRKPAGAYTRVLSAVSVLIGLVLVCAGCVSSSTARNSVPIGLVAPGCVAPAVGTAQDNDPRDSPEKPWQRVPGQKVTVYFENHSVSDRYWNMVRKSTEIWSGSPCVQQVAVAACPENSNCVAVREKERGSSRSHTDGEFSGKDRGQYRSGGTLTLYPNVLDAESDNGVLATVVHEMGHAVGLVHRNDRNDVMNGTTTDQTKPTPDDVDFANLLVIYGEHR